MCLVNLRQLIAVTVLVGAIFVSQPCPAFAEDFGLDLVLLIDVSRSMYTQKLDDANNPKAPVDGSDPWRIRWDAVKLALDLLTADDRVFVGRFSGECPPPFDRILTDEKGDEIKDAQGKPKRGPYQIFSSGDNGPKSLFQRASDEFPESLLSMTVDNRKVLSKLADLHNTREDVRVFSSGSLQNGLDYGGTNILAALSRGALALKPTGQRTKLGRRSHVLLLTDGLDSSMLDDSGKSLNTKTLTVLKELGQDGSGRISVPVHTLGLRICDLPLSERQPARTLLRELSATTQGVHREIAGTRDLVPFFRELIRDVKGYWTAEQTIAANQPNAEFLTHAGAGIQGLAVMVYGEPTGTRASPKESLLAPEDFTFRWTNSDVWAGGKPAEPDLRFGKQETLYRLLTFGPTDTQPSSPFAKLPIGQTATLSCSMRSQSYAQRVAVLKSPVQEPFSLEEPRTETPWKRHASNFRIQVRMRPTALFRHEDFRVIAEWRRLVRLDLPPVSDSSTDDDPLCHNGEMTAASDAVQLIPLSITEREKDSWTFSSGYVCLDQLLPLRTNGTDDCQLTIMLEGMTDRDHPLSGCRRRMPPRTIRIEHEPITLEKPTMPITLTNDQPKQTVVVKPRGCLGRIVPMQLKFVPPGEEDAPPLEASLFKVEADWTDVVTKSLELRPEGTAITVSLPPKDAPRPLAGKNYLPGRLEFSLMEDGQWRPRLTVPVELQLDLIPLRFSARPETLVASDTPQVSSPLRLATVKTEDARHVGDHLEVVLRPAPPDVEQKSKPAAFPANQLWLQVGDETVPIGEAERKQRHAVKLGQPFHVWFLPVGNTSRGRFHYELRISGAGLTGSPVAGSVEVGNFQIKRSGNEPLSLFSEPGQVADAQFGLRLTGRRGAKDEEEAVHIRGLDIEQPGTSLLAPVDQTEPKYRVELRGPTPAKPVKLPTMPLGDTNIAFQLVIPAEAEMPAGRYTGSLAVAGDGITTAQMPFTLLIDRLKLQIPLDTPGGRTWVYWKDDPERFTQFANRIGQREVRIVRASSLPLRKEDIEGAFSSPFIQDLGHTQRDVPTVAEIADDPAGQGVILRIGFPKVTNFDSRRYPYRVKLWVRSAANSANIPPFLPVQGEFAVQYVRLPDLLPKLLTP